MQKSKLAGSWAEPAQRLEHPAESPRETILQGLKPSTFSGFMPELKPRLPKENRVSCKPHPGHKTN